MSYEICTNFSQYFTAIDCDQIIKGEVLFHNSNSLSQMLKKTSGADTRLESTGGLAKSLLVYSKMKPPLN